MAADDTTIPTRVFAAGRASFVVDCSSAEIRDAVEALFVDLPDGDGANARRVALGQNPDGTLTLIVADEPDLIGQRPNEALAGLVTTVSRMSLDADPDRLHLHCAALSFGGRGVLISAASGTGKTTLAAALAQRGWTYVSDEAVGFVQDRPTGTGFPKPLMIKPGGGDLLPELVAARVTLDAADDQWLHVPASAMSALTANEVDPGLIVILYRAPDGSTDAHPVWASLHPADAVVEMMGQTMDAERFGPSSVDVLAELAARCRCIALQVGPLDAAADVLGELVGKPKESHLVRVLDSRDRGAGVWRIAKAVRSVLVGERVVVHDTNGGAIAALDEAGTGVWLALHGEAPAWWNPDALFDAGTVAFLDQLESHGLLSRSAANEPAGA